MKIPIKSIRFEKGWLQEYVYPTDTVMDFGCGLMALTRHLQCKKIYGFDIWQPYINQLKDEIKDERFVFKQMDIPKEIHTLDDKCIDISLAIDVVEHFEKPEALYVIKHMERIARKRIIIFTPLGFLKQEDGSGWGKDNPQHQKHRCGFTHSEFHELGYKTIQRKGGDHIAILAIKNIE